MKKTIIFYGLSIAFILLAVQVSQYQLFAKYISFEVFIGLLALGFTIIGVWFGIRLTSPKIASPTTNLQGEFAFGDELISYGLSKRETEILEQIDLGKSNQEIADDLFISISTVKTHISNLFSKLDVKNRVQAIQKAKEIVNTTSTKV